MAVAKVTLSEKGFGSATRGASTILADENGGPLFLGLVKLKDGRIGGRAVLVPLSQLRKNAKSFINSSSSVYEMKLEHKNNVGIITILHYDVTGEIVSTKYESLITVEDGIIKIGTSYGMENTEESKQLLEGKLYEAYRAAIERAFCQNPDHIFYGRVALDAGILEISTAKQEQTVEV